MDKPAKYTPACDKCCDVETEVIQEGGLNSADKYCAYIYDNDEPVCTNDKPVI